MKRLTRLTGISSENNLYTAGVVPYSAAYPSLVNVLIVILFEISPS